MTADPIRTTRTAWRALARSPGLVIAAVVSLGIGIGANLTMFGVLRAIEFPILPYPDASRLVQLDASNALGAEPAALVRRVLAEGLRVAIVGGVVGVLIARAGGRVLQSLVYGVQTTDPASFAAALLVLLVVVIAGAWVPARRASVTDPAIALKAD